MPTPEDIRFANELREAMEPANMFFTRTLESLTSTEKAGLVTAVREMIRACGVMADRSRVVFDVPVEACVNDDLAMMTPIEAAQLVQSVLRAGGTKIREVKLVDANGRETDRLRFLQITW